MAQTKSTNSRRTIILIAIVAIGVVTPMVLMSRNTSRPQLDVTNTGSTAVSCHHGGDEFVIQPATTWGLRYAVGDTLTFSVDAVGKSKTVVLDREGQGIGMRPVKFRAEVNADGEDIHFRFIDG